MSLETSYEVLEMLRDDGVQTFRAREKATGRGLELHLFLPFGRPENKNLFEKLKSLPLESRKSFLDIGFDGSTPYVVTDPLTGGRGFKSWAEELIGGSQPAASSFNPAILNTPPSRDDGVQILQAGQWRTGTPIPDSLKTTPPVPPPQPPKAAPPQTGDFTRMFQAPAFLNDPNPPEPPPGEFTGFFQSNEPANPPGPHTTQELKPPIGEFTGLFQAQTPKPTPPPPPAPPPAAAPEPPSGDFTRMFQAPSSMSSPPPPQAEPAGGGVEFTKYFENPLKPSPRSSLPPTLEMPPAPPPKAAPHSGGFTDIFGKPSEPPPSGGFSFDSPAPPPPPPGPVFGAMPSATGAFSAQPSWSQPQAPPSFPSGPSEYTKMMSAQQASAAVGPSVFNAPPNAPAAPQAPATKSNTMLFIILGVVAVLAIAIVVFLILRTSPTIPAAK